MISIDETQQYPKPPSELVAAISSMRSPGIALIPSVVVDNLRTCHQALLASLTMTDSDLLTLVAQAIDVIDLPSISDVEPTHLFMTTTPPPSIEPLIDDIDKDLNTAELMINALHTANPQLTIRDLLSSQIYSNFRDEMKRIFPSDNIDELEELIRILAAKHLSS